MLMIGGEFDLSVGSVVGAASMIVAICTGYYSLNPWIGVDPGLPVRRRLSARPTASSSSAPDLPSFIVTLATMLMVMGGMLGVSIGLTGSSSISAMPLGLGRGRVRLETCRVPRVDPSLDPALRSIATYVMQRTVFGNWVYATGGNAADRAARRRAGRARQDHPLHLRLARRCPVAA